MAKLKIGVMGARGYTGEELIRILINHPEVEITALSARVEAPVNTGDMLPLFRNRVNIKIADYSAEDIIKKCDLIFLALPHKVSMEVVPAFLKAKKKVIDLSADYRLKDANLYNRWYGVSHKDPENIALSVYGLPEIYREKIRKSEFIANPGCYPTAVILGAAPLFKNGVVESELIVDAKSGVSGAGRSQSVELL
ncbi:MAG: N-acetyl-gamma-glutamyl-phosphate reductase, partial [Candidatus Omnitrophica bacterium]|nr:N-acetyl-gamma-glutamyl-phosphate reductase [Candidatus Omnitrophota bacterium]